MKKLFLFISAGILTLSLNSCSTSSSGGGSLSMKINGTKKNFRAIAYQAFGGTFVHAYIGNGDNPTETIDFEFPSGTGDIATDFTYDNGTSSYDATTFTSNITTNSSSLAKGTFSGTLDPIGSGANLTITEGTFSASVVIGE